MPSDNLVPDPVVRKLRIFAFDPSVSAQFDSAGIDVITVRVNWEDVAPGPVGEYIEVIDADPASKLFYKPVDLNQRSILAQDGIGPSETNPQFHQQMVYAVAMTTISHFERALGRVALWSSHRPEGGADAEFVRRLRIYPHALRDRNAYYSPDKKALLFGYFPVGIKDAVNTPGALVFTCLSHDVIAHETTHALLDGVHPRFNEPINPDVLAFHEAVADIVALFQHFSYPGVLRSQIATTRGDLTNENLLGQLAQQFGKASGRGTALRDALGDIDKATGKWAPHKPDVRALDRTPEAHARGAILVAAVFGAFLKVYRAQTVDLYRIASEGTGLLRAGEIPGDLAARLADEAAKCAQYVLQMCIRAIDYCPPVGITFGDYLRAIVTADFDLNPDDVAGYRRAFVESFRQWGIQPEGMRSMSIESLLWPDQTAAEEEANVHIADEEMRSLFKEAQQPYYEEQSNVGAASKVRLKDNPRLPSWDLDSDRRTTWENSDDDSVIIWSWLMKGKGRKLLPIIGIVEDGAPPTVFRSEKTQSVAVEVHSVRRSLRRTARGGTVADLVVEITQRRRGYFDPDVQLAMDKAETVHDPNDKGDFRYRAGCTLLIDSKTMKPRRVIRTAGRIDDEKQLERVRKFLTEGGLAAADSFMPARNLMTAKEPFALLHRSGEV